MVKLKLTDLKKELKGMEQKELIELMAELYKTIPEVQSFLSSRFMGEEAIQSMFETAKKKIEDEFFPERGYAKLRLKEAKNVISQFKKLTKDELKTIDLMIVYVEKGTEFTNAYGDFDERFYDSMLSMFGKACVECSKNEEVYHLFKDRLYNILESSVDNGWGYHDGLCEIYFSMGWDGEDD